MASYLWFHAFHRPNAADVLDVLRAGPGPNQGHTTRTCSNEATLGISPSCVYAYLGRTLECFGSSALCVPLEALAGKVSPFDTGGLVDHLEPVRNWSDEEKGAYLRRYSWDATRLAELLSEYPGGMPEATRRYLDGTRPSQSGPHEIWDETPRILASIWSESNDCRAWLWEGRTSATIGVGALVGWSCSAATYEGVLRHIESLPNSDDSAWLELLLERYVAGGVGSLVRALRSHQEVA